MNDARRVLTLGAFRASYNATYASLDRVCDDLQSVCEAVNDRDPFLPDFDSGEAVLATAARLRAQAAHAAQAALALSAAASSFEALALLASTSVSAAPSSLRAVAVAPASARRRS